MKLSSIILPIAILSGLLLHSVCNTLYVAVPYLIFTMLLLNYCALDVRKMHLSRMHLWLLLTQGGLCLVSYAVMWLCKADIVLAHGLLVCILTPVAGSVVVVACVLGANRETVTTFTILDNLAVAVAAPVLFSVIGRQTEMAFFTSFGHVFARVCPQIVLPFVTALVLQHRLPRVNAAISRYSSMSLYVWAVILTIVLGRTFHSLFTATETKWWLLAWMCVLSIVLCVVQFGLGKAIGNRYKQAMAGGQMLGQKNTSFGIWMAVEYLDPYAAVFPAFYSIAQNVFNSWQMWQHERKKQLTQSLK